MRENTQKRATKETKITAYLSLDGGEKNIHTGIGFFDHMLDAFATHGNFGLQVIVEGDLDVDSHHTVEDTGIVLGKAFKEAVGNKIGIARYGNMRIPMDEALAVADVDVSGRPHIRFSAEFPQEKVGNFDACLCEEFMSSFAMNAGMTLHINIPYGTNSHHQIEAAFKAVAHALRKAVQQTHTNEILSTKGSL